MKPGLTYRLSCAAAGSLAVVCLGLSAPGVQGQEGGDIRLKEADVTIESLFAEIAELKKALVESEAKVSSLGEALASANSESAHFQEAYKRIRLQMEALGVSVLDADGRAIERRLLQAEDGRAIERRLLQAVNDVRLLQDENNGLREEIHNLTEALLLFMKSSVGAEPEARKIAEEAVAAAEARLLEDKLPTDGEVGDLSNATVISLKNEFGLVVFNVGAKHGVREGMPFRVVRKDRPIGTVMVVDVRDKISGAVVQAIEEDETFAVGDIGRVNAD